MKLIYWINRRLPFSWLPIACINTGNETCTLRKDGWVIISDGKSTDALPILRPGNHRSIQRRIRLTPIPLHACR
jgi:hypothetical protein